MSEASVPSSEPNPPKQHRLGRVDVALAALVAAIAGYASFDGSGRVHPALMQDPYNGNTWFESDLPRVYYNMTDRGSNHYRTQVHPLFSITTNPPVSALIKYAKMDPLAAVRSMVVAIASVVAAVFFLVLRLGGCRRIDSLVFSMLALTSASAVFWFTVPETYAWGLLSILLALMAAELSSRRGLSEFWHVLVGSLTLSFTVTNWMSGLALTLLKCGWRRAIQISVNAFCVVMVLALLQRALFPTAGLPFALHEESEYIAVPDSGGALNAVRAFFLHSMVMPQIVEREQKDRPLFPRLTVQSASHADDGMWGRCSVGIWIILLILGCGGLFALRRSLAVRLLAITIVGQLALHLCYGGETFLYAAHFGPLLVIFAALGTRTRARPVVLAGAVALTIAGGINNFARFADAVGAFVKPVERSDMQEGDWVFLSDLRPTVARQGWRRVTSDKSVSGRPIRLGKRARRYARGLGTHSPLTLTYEIPKGSRFFACDVGISHWAKGKGSVVVSIELDGIEVFRSPTITGEDEPIRVNVPLGEAGTITLRLDPAGDGTKSDHVDWAMARFVFSPGERLSGQD